MEAHGPLALGKLYKDPITSFRHFHRFSVNHPEARACLHFSFKQMCLRIRVERLFWRVFADILAIYTR